MESNAFALKTGAFLLAAIAVIAFGWSLFDDNTRVTKPYRVVSSESVSGLAPKARVYYKGVDVGTVEEIYFDAPDFDQVNIRIHVDAAIPIAENTYAQLALRGITGEYDLRLDNDGDLGEPLTTDEANLGEIPMRSQYIAKLGESIEQVVEDVDEVARRVSIWLDDETRDRFLTTMDSIDKAAEAISSAGNDMGGQLDDLAGRLRELSTNLDQTLNVYRELGETGIERSEELATALKSLTQTSDDLSRVLVRLEGRTVDQSEESLREVAQAARTLNEAIEQLQQDPQRLIIGAARVPPGPGEHSQ